MFASREHSLLPFEKPMPTTGEMIGPYVLGVCLGQGGFGAVYEATHQETGQRVALKFLLDTKQLESEVQSRFVREVALLQKLDHENVVRHFEAGLHEGSIYCAMELVECGSLKEVLASRRKLPWRESAEVALQLCRALEHAHARGCIHRDLKPANLFLSEDGVVKLGDLGLARDLNDSRLTASGRTVGTWRYMPPEQITGQSDIDGRLDLYAAGCILFEMVAGRVPFDGPDFVTIFDQHLESMPPRLDLAVSDCPQHLADLVEQLLAKLPAERPASATEVVESLENILSGKPEPLPHPRVRDSITIPDGGISATPNLTQRLQNHSTIDIRKTGWKAFTVTAIFLTLVVAILLIFQLAK